MPLYLTEADVESLFEPADAVPIVEDSFRRLAAGEVVNQPRLRLQLNGPALALMGAVDSGLGIAGSKTYVRAFVVSLFDATSGECIGVVEANRLGQLRTGAATGVAAKPSAAKANAPSASTLAALLPMISSLAVSRCLLVWPK